MCKGGRGGRPLCGDWRGEIVLVTWESSVERRRGRGGGCVARSVPAVLYGAGWSGFGTGKFGWVITQISCSVWSTNREFTQPSPFPSCPFEQPTYHPPEQGHPRGSCPHWRCFLLRRRKQRWSGGRENRRVNGTVTFHRLAALSTHPHPPKARSFLEITGSAHAPSQRAELQGRALSSRLPLKELLTLFN